MASGQCRKQKSSTWRELKAVAEVLGAVGSKLSDLRLRWFTDNQNVVRIIQVGSKKEELQLIAIKILSSVSIMALSWNQSGFLGSLTRLQTISVA